MIKNKIYILRINNLKIFRVGNYLVKKNVLMTITRKITAIVKNLKKYDDNYFNLR